MKKVIISLSLIVASVVSTTAQTTNEFKLGYVNMEYIFVKLKATPPVKLAESELQTFVAQKRMVLQKLEGELNELQQQGQSAATQMQQQAIQAELEGKYKRYQLEEQAMQQQAAQKEQELMQPTLDKISKTIEKVGDAEGYTYVFSNGLGGNSIILFAKNKGDNLTVKVLAELGIVVPDEIK